jgi:hypothetical protein
VAARRSRRGSSIASRPVRGDGGIGKGEIESRGDQPGGVGQLLAGVAQPQEQRTATPAPAESPATTMR